MWARTCYVLPNGHTTSQPDLTAYTATALHHTQKNTTKSSAPEDGHKVARNMLSNLQGATYKGEITIILSDI